MVMRMPVILVMRVRRVMMMLVPVSLRVQNNHADAIHNQPEDRHEDRLVEYNLNRVEQPRDTFKGHEQREDREQYRTRKTSERVHLAGAKAVATVARVAASIGIGKGGDAQRRRVRCHMQAVCQQSHGAKDNAGDQFDHHHNRCYGNNEKRSAFAGPALILRKGMLMLVTFKIVFVHAVYSPGNRKFYKALSWITCCRPHRPLG